MTLPTHCPTCGAEFDTVGDCLCNVRAWENTRLAVTGNVWLSAVYSAQLERIAVALERISTAIDEIQKKVLFK